LQAAYRDPNVNQHIGADQTIANVRNLSTVRIQLCLFRVSDGSIDQEWLTKIKRDEAEARRDNG
jgi:hypothetical protein